MASAIARSIQSNLDLHFWGRNTILYLCLSTVPMKTPKDSASEIKSPNKANNNAKKQLLPSHEFSAHKKMRKKHTVMMYGSRSLLRYCFRIRCTIILLHSSFHSSMHVVHRIFSSPISSHSLTVFSGEYVLSLVWKICFFQ